MNKREIFRLIEQGIENDIANAERARQASQDDADEHIGAMHSRYDTFKEEAQYLAAGHEARKIELTGMLSVFRSLAASSQTFEASDRIQVGSIVCLEFQDCKDKQRYVLAPAGGGMELICNGEEYFVITPLSPLGRSLIGKKVGEEAKIGIGGKTSIYGILEIL